MNKTTKSKQYAQLEMYDYYFVTKIKWVDVTDMTVVPAYYGHDRRVYSTDPL